MATPSPSTALMLSAVARSPVRTMRFWRSVWSGWNRLKQTRSSTTAAAESRGERVSASVRQASAPPPQSSAPLRRGPGPLVSRAERPPHRPASVTAA